MEKEIGLKNWSLLMRYWFFVVSSIAILSYLMFLADMLGPSNQYTDEDFTNGEKVCVEYNRECVFSMKYAEQIKCSESSYTQYGELHHITCYEFVEHPIQSVVCTTGICENSLNKMDCPVFVKSPYTQCYFDLLDNSVDEEYFDYCFEYKNTTCKEYQLVWRDN